jgi:hypothetical protein
MLPNIIQNIFHLFFYRLALKLIKLRRFLNFLYHKYYNNYFFHTQIRKRKKTYTQFSSYKRNEKEF